MKATWYTNSNVSGRSPASSASRSATAAILYVYSGAGSRSGSSWYAPLGVGAEFKLADNLGLKTEAQYNFDLDNSAENSAALKVGLNWHF